jgi:hypothetical protein
MPRSYSEKAFPHRILFDAGADGQRGDDVKVVRRNVLERLEARGIERRVGPNDGLLRAELIAAGKTAAHFLGAPDDWTESKSGLLVREQRIIVYPERRTEEMLASASARMERLLADRRKGSTPGRLNDAERVRARRIAVASFRLAYQHAPQVHYTMGSGRFGGIRAGLRYADGRYPTNEDCSSMYTWALWNALTSVAGMGFPDVVNGADFKAGYTGTLLSHGERVDNRIPGDAVIYGSGFPGKHVAMVAEDTDMVYSHGSEAGPFYVRWNYRSDVMQTRRFIL